MNRWGTMMLMVLVVVVALGSLYNCGGNGSDPPAAPSGLQVDSTGLDCVTLSWVDNADNEDGFHLERGDADTGPWSVIVLSGANIQGYSDSPLDSGTTYYYRVRAYNSDENSSYTDVVSALTAGPSPPTNLQVDSTTTDSVTLSWVDNATNETGFHFEGGYSPVGPFVLLADLGPDEVSYTESGLDSGWYVYFRIQAYNADGSSPYSEVVLAATQTVSEKETMIPAIADSLSTWGMPWGMHGYLMMFAYDSSGYETTRFTFLDPGSDSEWGTTDDDLSNYGVPTHNPDGTIDYLELYDGGPDNDLYTEDDFIISFRDFTYDSSGNLIERWRISDPGADGIWGSGGDDTVSRYDEFFYDSNNLRTGEIYYDDPGIDLDWSATEDNVVDRVYKYYYDQDGLLELRTRSVNAGPDEAWFTTDDVVSMYYTYDHDSNGYRVRQKAYSMADVMLYYEFWVTDASGKVLGEYEYVGPGSDGVWFE